MNLLAPLILATALTPKYPARTHILLSEVKRGKLHLLYSHGNHSRTSRRSFWPASTIKLMPALALVMWAKRRGIPLASRLQISDKTGSYDGTLARLLRLALGPSSNTAYNRIVFVVGVKGVNRTARRMGLRHTCIGTAYTKRDNLHRSPAFRLYYRGKWHRTPARRFRRRCWSNRTSLRDLQRTIVKCMKYRSLRSFTSIARSPMRRAIVARFGKVRIFHKTGYVGRLHALDNALFKSRSGRWYALSIATPSRHAKPLRRGASKADKKKAQTDAYRRSMRLLNRLAQQALTAGLKTRRTKP